MPLDYPRLDYTARDFFALRKRAFDEIRSVYPEWTDDQVANFGNLLVEQACAVGDTLSFYMDQQANESRLTTARLLPNARAHAKLAGYAPRGQTAARAQVRFTLKVPAAAPVVVPKYTRVTTKEITSPLVYETQQELTLATGSTTGLVVTEHSAHREYAVAATGLPDLTVVLPAAPFLDDGSLTVTATSGEYARADTPLGYGPQDRVYSLDLDAQDRAVVRFGAGDVGLPPVGLVVFKYKTGGGRAGRVDAGKLTQVQGGLWRDQLGDVVELSATNPERSTPAEDREGVESIRRKAPQVVRVQRRAVAREDFEISAEQVPGVVRALYVTKNELPSIEENRGLLYVVPSGLGEAPAELLDEVRARFAPGGATPSHVTHRVDVRGPLYLPVVGVARVHLARAVRASTTAKAAVAAQARAAWAAFFAPDVTLPSGEVVANDAVDFGFYYQDGEGEPVGSLAWSDLHDVVRDVPGITRVAAGPTGFTVNGSRDDLPISPVAFPVDGGFTLVDVESGEVL